MSHIHQFIMMKSFFFYFQFHSRAQWLFALFLSFLGWSWGLRRVKYITLCWEWKVHSTPNQQLSVCAQKLFNYLILIVSKLPFNAHSTPLCGYLMVKWKDIWEMKCSCLSLQENKKKKPFGLSHFPIFIVDCGCMILLCLVVPFNYTYILHLHEHWIFYTFFLLCASSEPISYMPS